MILLERPLFFLKDLSHQLNLFFQHIEVPHFFIGNGFYLGKGLLHLGLKFIEISEITGGDGIDLFLLAFHQEQLCYEIVKDHRGSYGNDDFKDGVPL